MNKDKIREELTILFWIFIIGSIAGFIFEITVVFFQKGYFELRQGLIYGPFIPVYGIGAMLYYVVLNKNKLKNKLQIFLITMLLGGLTEYLCSFTQEKLFGTISWDYSYLPFNINGRTSLLHCIYWGIGGVLFVRFILPLIRNLNEWCKNTNFRFITAFLVLFITFDIVMSGMAGSRQLERKNNIAANGYIDNFFDEYYPDTKLEQIYSNAKTVN